MTFPRYFILNARRANLVEYLQSKGYSLKREGKNWRLLGFGGLVVRENSFYRFSTRDGGNALDFCLRILGMSFREAVLSLNGVSTVNVVQSLPALKEEKKVLDMPTRYRNEHRVIAYLTKSRGLPSDMVVGLIRAGLLYQDERGNCVFVCRDLAGNSMGAILAGTVSSISWKGIATGSDTTFGWWWPPVGVEDIVTVVEAPIDAMSLAVIDPGVRHGHVLALGGLHREALEGFLGHVSVRKVVLAIDNDKWGRKASFEWREWLALSYEYDELIPIGKKDWNEILLFR